MNVTGVLLWPTDHQLFWESNILARQALWEANLPRHYIVQVMHDNSSFLRAVDWRHYQRWMQMTLWEITSKVIISYDVHRGMLHSPTLSSLLMVCLWRRMWMFSDNNTTEQLPRGLCILLTLRTHAKTHTNTSQLSCIMSADTSSGI